MFALLLAAVGLGAPLFVRSNYDMGVPAATVAQTVSSADANAALSGQAADLTLGVTVNHLTAFKALQSDFVQNAVSGASLFLPFLAEGAEIKADGSSVTVQGSEDLEEKYNEGARKFSLHTNCLKHAESVAKTLESLATKDSKRALSYVVESPETAAFRRRLQVSLGDDDETTGVDEEFVYQIACTPIILSGLLLGLFLLTVAYCGFTIMMDVETPLRTRAKMLPVRKEF